MKLDSVFDSTVAWAKSAAIWIHAFDELASTNTTAKEQAFDQQQEVVIWLADLQTEGRGRGLNRWSGASHKGHNLNLSLRYRVTKPVQPPMSPLVGLALYGAAATAFPSLSWSLKAPNDLYLADRKVAGVLIETVMRGEDIALIIGLGMNVLSAPPDVATATCLNSQDGLERPPLKSEWRAFLNQFHLLVDQYIPHSQDGQIPERERLLLLKALRQYPNLSAQIDSVSPEGDLHTSNGILSWRNL